MISLDKYNHDTIIINQNDNYYEVVHKNLFVFINQNRVVINNPCSGFLEKYENNEIYTNKSINDNKDEEKLILAKNLINSLIKRDKINPIFVEKWNDIFDE